MMIKGVIFDMDGVLTDSEPLWQRTEVDIFRELGITLTEEMQVQTKGLRSDEMVHYWYSRFPGSYPPQESLVEEYEKRMIDLFWTKARLMEGADRAIRFFKELNLPVALASSSPMFLINIILDRFGLRKYFSVIYSAEHEPYGKPHPNVYLNTAKLLGCHPSACLAIEDSFHGVIAARAARMKVIAMPGPGEAKDRRFGAADRIISSLNEINRTIFDELNH
ncbi:MAG: hexitol phosphatase HxpB [Bacteroidales bacterium]|nr:hexitol phosphatase HxpB [Bacteroidales bacterium]